MKQNRSQLVAALLGLSIAGSSSALELNFAIVDTCPLKGAPEQNFAPLVVGILATLAGNIVAGVVDGIAAKLKADGSFSRTRVLPLDGLYRATSDGTATSLSFVHDKKCLVVAVADGFAKPLKSQTDIDTVSQALPFVAGKGGTPGILYDTLGLRKNPVFYAEFGLFAGGFPQQSVFMASPQYVYYPDWVVTGWRYASSRDVSLMMEWSIPGQSNPFASDHLSLTDVSKDQLTADTLLFAWSSGWMPLASTDGLPTQYVAGRTYRPVNLKVMFVETAHPNVFASALAQTLTDSKASLQTAAQDVVKQSLDPVAKSTAAASSAAAFATANKAYTDAYATALALKDEYGKATTSDAIALAKAKFMAQVATLRALGDVAYQAAIAMGNGTAFTRLPDPTLA